MSTSAPRPNPGNLAPDGKCPSCRSRIVRRSVDGISLRVGSEVTVAGDGEVNAKCYFCKRSVTLPIRLVEVPADEPRDGAIELEEPLRKVDRAARFGFEFMPIPGDEPR